MEVPGEATRFAPAERAGENVLRQQSRAVLAAPLLQQLLDAVEECVLILNEQRQIVFCNRSALRLSDARQREDLYGLRPGEALGCIHATENPGGCGTTQFCATCGAVDAILISRKGMEGAQECRIRTSDDGRALDLRVYATPFNLADESLTIFALTDISDQKRRRALEHVFFHDLLNIALGLKLLCRQLEQRADAGMAELCRRVTLATQELTREIEGQRMLANAESGELRIRPERIRSRPLLEDLQQLHRSLAVDRNCHLRIHEETAAVTFHSDRTILSRVLANMLTNAIEASGPGDTVTMDCRASENAVEFRVHNPAHMPREVRLQVFQRSFSTKGEARGLGTHSMKLLTERYLGGEVWFETSESEGTVFHVRLPGELKLD